MQAIRLKIHHRVIIQEIEEAGTTAVHHEQTWTRGSIDGKAGLIGIGANGRTTLIGAVQAQS